MLLKYAILIIMTNQLTEAKVIRIIKSIIDTPNDLNGDFIINSIYGWDSLTVINLIVSLEKEFNINLNLDYFSTERKVSDIVEMITN